MKRTFRGCALPFVCGLLWVGCSQEAERNLPDGLDAQRPFALESGLFFPPSAALEQPALSLDLSAEQPRIIEHELSSPVAVSAPRPGDTARQVVVLTRGQEARSAAGKRTPVVVSELLVLDRAGLARRAHKLSGRFGQLALSDDGRYAIAHAPVGVGAQNLVEVVDLEQLPPPLDSVTPFSSQVVLFSLTGLAPSRFVFAPASFGRRLVVVPFADSVQLLDLERPQAGLTSIPLKTATDPRTVQPGEVLFAAGRIFVQASNSADVFVVRLLPSDNAHGFVPGFSLLTASAPVRDIALAGEGEGARLLALAERLELFNPDQGSVLALDSVRGFGGVLPFTGASPDDELPASRALVYTRGQSKVGFVDLASDSELATRAVEQIELGSPLTALVPLASRKLALALHSGSRLSVVDLEQRTVFPLTLDSALASWLVDESESTPRLWLLTGSGTLAVVELTTLVTREIPLEVDGARVSESGDGGQLLLIPGAPARRVAVLHRSETGRITLLDAQMPTRESARELAGFSLSGLFD